jgi:hypothetical protein
MVLFMIGNYKAQSSVALYDIVCLYQILWKSVTGGETQTDGKGYNGAISLSLLIN